MSYLIDLNNPGGLRSFENRGYDGFVRVSLGYCEFRSIHYGIASLIRYLRDAISEHGFGSVSDVIRYLSGVRSYNYAECINFVLSYTGLCADDCFDSHLDSFYLLCQGICCFESGFVLTRSRFESVLLVFDL